MKDLIQTAFPGATVTVNGADGVHLSAEVIAEEFRGKNRVQQQRMVYAALKGLMDGPDGALHALALTTKIPD
ncbi:BolA/IbaG family iron-sulfur metabolism protein [Harenicola maris]|uniref:BolA/IbaG family iron-sulfur metabolism protein n=1 Tax=Harenicola maris TaxID=2841044 RepID=UPI00389914F8